jgi:hypothetical protein
MGSVPDLYTTGDNDPEIEPVQYYRHYLYCDACGSFELDSWMAPDNSESLEKARQRLGMTAFILSPVVVVSGWLVLGLIPSPTFLVSLAVALVLGLLLRGLVVGKQRAATIWRVAKGALLVVPAVVVAERLGTILFPPSLVLLAAVIVIVGLLVARGILGSKIEHVGVRCRRCGGTYAHGSPFFTDLDANPRDLTVADVPRPLGSSRFLVGRSVAGELPTRPQSATPAR